MLQVFDRSLRIIIFCCIIYVNFVVFSSFPIFKLFIKKSKAFRALQVRFKRKLLKKGEKKHTYNSNKLENCLPAKVAGLHFAFLHLF